MKSQAHSFAAVSGLGEPPPAGDGFNGRRADGLIFDELQDVGISHHGDFERAAAAADAAVDRLVFADMIGGLAPARGVREFVEDALREEMALYGRSNAGPTGILKHLDPRPDAVKVDPVGLNSRQARRAASREAMKLLDRRGRGIEKRIAIAGKLLRQANKVAGQMQKAFGQ